MESETAAPGEKRLFLGVREQRVTTLGAHVLIGLSIFLTPVQQKVPLAVLLGVFLYMGVTCLSGQQVRSFWYGAVTASVIGLHFPFS